MIFKTKVDKTTALKNESKMHREIIAEALDDLEGVNVDLRQEEESLLDKAEALKQKAVECLNTQKENNKIIVNFKKLLNV